MAAGLITTGSAPKTLWPGIYAFWGQNYDEHQMLYRNLFEIKNSEKAYEETPELIGFGLAPVKEQGTSVQFDTWRQGPVTRYTHKPYALGFIVTHEEQADNLYEEVVMERTARLAFSMRTTKEIVHANVYNRAFNANFVGGDGKNLLAADHPTDNGVQSNVLATAADLSETALEDLVIQIANTEDSRGLRINLQAVSLIVPTNLMFTAERILGSMLQNDTANNAVNALRTRGSIRDGYYANTYLNSPDAWFVRTNVRNGMCSFNREDTEFSEDNDFDTDNYKYKAYMRFEPGWSDFRGLFGSPGS